jgi:hypothetical protein
MTKSLLIKMLTLAVVLSFMGLGYQPSLLYRQGPPK